MADSFEERDRGICEMWNDGASVGAIGRRYQMTNAGVYAVIRRRRDKGYEVKSRYSYDSIRRHNMKRFENVKRRALKLEVLANDGRIDVFRELNTKAAAQVMDVSKTTLWRHARRGTLKTERRGHLIRYRLVDLIEWANSL